MPPTPLAPRLALGGLLLCYGVVLCVLIGAVAGGSDNSGYFNEARLLAQGRIHAAQRTLPTLPGAATPPYCYVPLGFKPSPGLPRQMVPTYPPGLPLLFVPASWIAGWTHAGDLTLLVHALAGLALTFALGRGCGLTRTWSLVGALILAASPLYLFLSLQALSDVPAATWATAAVVAALGSRRHPGLAFVSGLGLGVGLLIRPTNALMALPVALAIGWSPRRLALAAAGALPGAAALLAINHAAYGHALESGYGAIGAEFHSDLIVPTFEFYTRWLPLLLSPVIVLLPLVLARRGQARREEIVLFVWAALFVGFYSAYRWTHEQWWFLRFVLPAAPALVVGGLGVARHLLAPAEARALGPWKLLVPLAVLGLALGFEFTQQAEFGEAKRIGRGERKYGRVATWLKRELPANAVIVTSQASGALFYFTDFILVRTEDMTPPFAGRLLAAAAGEHRGTYAVLFPFERAALARLPGHWTPLGSVDDVMIWRADPPPRS
jgi:4-amino-4-deoxy-L-arabinose transferase-like glycosyltransferase